ncbi:MAG: hypothetical protein IH945_02530 [Armatimonadetes bacterium]|nr:hypothetical protein [Armatimonadota bacterium]
MLNFPFSLIFCPRGKVALAGSIIIVGARKIITDIDFTDLSIAIDGSFIERLAYYARAKVNRYPWPQGYSRNELAQDMAMDAIAKALTGKRTWNREIKPDPFDFLKSIVDSLVWSELKKSKHPVVATSDLNDHEASSADVAEQIVERDEVEKLILDVIDALGKDDLALDVVGKATEGITEPSELAKILDVDKSDILAAKKRIRRAAERVQRKPIVTGGTA